MSVIVLMSTYNGEKYLSQQLDSLINQSLKPDKILIRDDGSSDNTIDIINEYKKQYAFIDYYTGDNLGPGKSFWDLINNCKKYDYYALCDQDDVWFEDKLEVAIKTLQEQDNHIPLLYCSKYTLTDENLNPIDSNVSSLYNYSDFQHSLIYHTAPGCTFVFNDTSREKIKEYNPDKQYFVIHDAIIHKVVTLFGKMILDKTSHIYYRQHNQNQIGMSANKIDTFFKRIKHFISGDIKNYRSNTAKSLLEVYGEECDKDKRELINIVANYMNDKNLKKRFIDDKGFKSNTVNDVFLNILILVNYI